MDAEELGLGQSKQIPTGVLVLPAKLVDINNLLKKHYINDWCSLQILLNYKGVAQTAFMGSGINTQEKEDENVDDRTGNEFV